MNDLSNFVDFYSAYDDHFVSDYTNILRDNLEQDSKKEAARKLIDEKKAQLTEMQDKVTKITSLIGNNLANDLLISIDGNISLINAMSRSIDTITDGNDIEQALERYMTRFEERTSELQDYIAMTNDKFHESLYYAVKSKAVTINELEDLRNIDGLEEHEMRMIDDTIEQLREEKLDEELNTQAEQQSMEEEKGNNSELIPTPQPVFHPTVEFSNTNYESGTVEEDIEQKPLTLDEKIDNIQYERGMNYGQQVSQVRIDHEIENLNIRLNALKEKKDKNGKLSLKEAIELQSLVNQITHLESLKFNLGKKGQRRETKLANTSSKMASAEEGLVEEQSKDYQSKLFNFVSSIKQQNLSSKLKK